MPEISNVGGIELNPQIAKSSNVREVPGDSGSSVEMTGRFDAKELSPDEIAEELVNMPMPAGSVDNTNTNNADLRVNPERAKEMENAMKEGAWNYQKGNAGKFIDDISNLPGKVIKAVKEFFS